MEEEAYRPSSSGGSDSLVCPLCGQIFKQSKSLMKHLNKCQKYCGREEDRFKGRYKCEFCDTYFARISRVEDHMRRIHPPGKQALLFSCGICAEGFTSQKELHQHRQTQHVKTNDFTVMATAFRRHAMHLRAWFDTPLTMDEAIVFCCRKIPPVLETSQVYNKLFKCGIVLFVELYKVDLEGNASRTDIFTFRADAFIVRPFNDFFPDVVRSLKSIVHQVEEFLHQVNSIAFVTLQISGL
jgi:uncharacterized C2H2 Zn-finger protein